MRLDALHVSRALHINLDFQILPVRERGRQQQAKVCIGNILGEFDSIKAMYIKTWQEV